MSDKNAKTAKNPLANLDAADLKIVARMADATRKVEKASETLNRVLAEAERAGLHTKAGFTNFGKWAEAVMLAKGVRMSKSRAYNALKIADVRDAAPKAETLPDTVCLRIAEAAPMGDPEAVAAFVDEVIATGGTVEAVRTVTGDATDDREPLDKAVEDFAARVVRLVRGDAKAADAALSYARSEITRLMVEATKKTVGK